MNAIGWVAAPASFRNAAPRLLTQRDIRWVRDALSDSHDVWGRPIKYRPRLVPAAGDTEDDRTQEERRATGLEVEID